MSFITDTFARGFSILIYVLAICLFVPALVSNPRFSDNNVFACVFSENGAAAACVWCCIVKFLAIALQAILDFLNKIASFFGAGNLSNPLSNQGGSPYQCLQNQGTTAYLTYFYIIIWFLAIYLFVEVSQALVHRIGKIVEFGIAPATFVGKLFINFFYAQDTVPRKASYRKMA